MFLQKCVDKHKRGAMTMVKQNYKKPQRNQDSARIRDQGAGEKRGLRFQAGRVLGGPRPAWVRAPGAQAPEGTRAEG